MAGNYYIPLPAAEMPRNAMLDGSGIANEIRANRQESRQNAMLEYQHGRDAKTDARAAQDQSMQQQRFDMQKDAYGQEKKDRALKSVAGLAQMVTTAPPDQQSVMWNKLRSTIPDFDADLTAAGVDPNDYHTATQVLIAKARGYEQPRDPLDAQFKQAQINKLNREADGGGQPTPDIKNYEYARRQGFNGSFDEYQKAQNEAKVPNGIKTDALRAQGAFTALDKELDNYAALVSRTGAAMLPGQEKDQVIQARRNLQLQMKELYNLGVLNGPDLALMDSMLPDPTVNNPMDITNAYNTGQRTTAAVAGLKAKMRELRDSKLGAAGMAVPPDAAAKLSDPLGIR